MNDNWLTNRDGDQHTEQSDLARLLSELVRAGWNVHIQLIPNDWMAVSHAEILFERAWELDSPRTLHEDMQAVKHGFAPQANVHWRFDPFAPRSFEKAVQRFHQLFVAPSRNA
jgi:hypothetical protein